MSLDKEIEKKADFEDVVNGVIDRALDIEGDFDRIYIDVNSVVSVLFRADDVNSKKIVESSFASFERIFTKYTKRNTEIYLLFSTVKSTYHVGIYEEWCKERYERVDLSKSLGMKELIFALKKFSEQNKLIRVINTKEFHPALIVKYLEDGTKNRFIVISKDTVFYAFDINHGSQYTGVIYIDYDDDVAVMSDRHKEVEIPRKMIKYYYALCGDKRNEFPGVSGYGPNKSIKYIKEYKLELEAGLEHPQKEAIEKYCKLYDVSNMLITADKEKLNKILG
jgi:hypothetical protein